MAVSVVMTKDVAGSESDERLDQILGRPRLVEIVLQGQRSSPYFLVC